MSASPTRQLEVLAPLALGFVCVEAAVSILARWPYQFTGQGDTDQMIQDFLCFGTLLSPPLSLIAILAATVSLIRREDRVGTIATAMLGAICAVMTVGSLGEALAPGTPDVPRSLQLIGGAFGAVAFAALAALAMRGLRART